MAVDALPPRRVTTPGRIGRLGLLSTGLAALTVLAQVLYPLVHGIVRDRLTVLIVCVFAAATVSHVWTACGARVAGLVLAITAGLGFGAEVAGVHTGFPFGHYAYSGTLGARLWGVPVVVGLAWTMFAWPAALVARRLVAGFGARVVLGAWALASWDLFLDPQMVAAGHWRWRDPSPHLPGVDRVPLTNYTGWLLVAVLISLALQAILRISTIADDRVPIALFAWTYVSSVLAVGVFLHLGAAAAWGALGMGLVAVPLAVQFRAR